jgi:iron complex outermembrane receptor protein
MSEYHSSAARNLGWWLTSVCMTATLWSCYAVAQDATSRGAIASNPAQPTTLPIQQELQEVVVTAEKRESNVQSTPISITAITGEQLEARGLTDLVSVAQEVPGVSFKSSGPGQTELAMRGLSSAGGESPTVGFYLDETPITPPAGASNGKVTIDPSLYDLTRIEILRGPQGTLYGAGSMGGTVKLVTNQPDPTKFRASAQSTLSGTDGGGLNYTVNTMANVPIVSDRLAWRVVLTDSYTSGWIDRVVLNPFPLETNAGTQRGNVLSAPVQQSFTNVNDERLLGARTGLLLHVSDRFDITASALYQRITMGALSLYDSPPGTEAHYEPYNVPEPFSDTLHLYSLVAKYSFDQFSVTSATSYFQRAENQTQDSAEALQSVFEENVFVPGAATLEGDVTHQFSQEIRLTSSGDGPAKWLVGGFYSDYTYWDIYNQSDIAYQTVYGLDSPELLQSTLDDSIKQRALFGEGSYEFTDKLQATVGLRYYSYSSSSNDVNAGLFSPQATTTPQLTTASASNSGLNPKVNLSYAPTGEILTYVTAAKGFRPGGPNQPLALAGPDSCLPSLEAIGRTQGPSRFGPDSVWSYELGEKSKWLNGRLTVNGDVYYERWHGVQQQVPLACGFVFQDNAGDAAVYGSEWEIAALVGQHLKLTASVSYTHATFLQSIAETGTVAGQSVLNVPKWTESTALEYTRPAFGTSDFVARISNGYVGSRQDVTSAINNLPSYDLVQARLGLAGKEERSWRVSLFANNVFNKQVALNNNNSLSINVPTFNRVSTNQPRTVGLGVEYRY